MEKLQKCVNFILTVPVFFATSCIPTMYFSRVQIYVQKKKTKECLLETCGWLCKYTAVVSVIPPPPGGTAILPEYIHY
jgi:hypothetical protein